ncbi:MAG: heavy metal translocating P-type ATPase [Elusimicrobiaceae bacterium]|nr:heavy metal translocating P-type ATPase [Elusimicrobiaceae bacterium]
MNDGPGRTEPRKVVISVEGMHCASCSARVEKKLSALKGVAQTRVHLPTKTVYVTFEPDAVSPGELTDALEDIGYTVTDFVDQQDFTPEAALRTMQDESRAYLRRFLCALGLTALLFFARFIDMSPYTQLLVTAAVWLWCGRHFHRGFWRSVKNLAPDMNTLVSISSSTAFIYSVLILVLPTVFYGRYHKPMWTEVALLITFINFGRWLESDSRRRAGGAVAKLMNLAPRFAHIVVGGAGKTVPIAQVTRGMVVSVKPAGMVPVDGVILKGSTTLDESLLTGESNPVYKAEGDRVFGGTLNKGGLVFLRAEGIGSESVLAAIVRSVREAQSSKSAVQRMADRVSFYFVPAVLLIAAVSACAWLFFGGRAGAAHAVTAFATVLAAACPCAMGLAVPVALAVGIDRAASLGILIKNADVLDRVGRINTVVFDKTGTLTAGNMTVRDIVPAEGVHEARLLDAACLTQSHSEHPLGEAVRKLCRARRAQAPDPDSFFTEQGMGVVARSGGTTFLAGRPAWLGGRGVTIADMAYAGIDSPLIAFAEGGRYLGFLAFTDEVRPEAMATVRRLKEAGIKVMIISGDREASVKQVAAACGVEEYRAGVLPADKAEIIKSLQAAGASVAMAGDGFNDAPALARADIGMALAAGTDIAVESADITFTRTGVGAVCEAVFLSRAIRRVMRQNLFWAFLYNILLIPLAAGAFYPALGVMMPVWAAGGAMGVSSVSVVLSSLRLRKMKIS